MGIPDCSRSKRCKETGVKDAPDFIIAAEIRPELPVRAAFGKDLVEIHVSLDADIGTHMRHPVSVLLQGRHMKVPAEDTF
jgi:hypothetical protein